MKRNGQNKTQVLTREDDGFDCVIKSTPGKEDGHTCMAANCGTLISTENFFCEYHFQRIPEDLTGLYHNARTEEARKLLLQQMVDYFSAPKSALESLGFHEPPDGPPEKIPLEYWDGLIGDFRDEIAGQQRLLADIIALRAKFYPDAPRETHEPRELPALLSDLRDFVQGVRDDILDSDPSAERIHAVQKIDSMVWRTTKALEGGK